MRYLFEDFAFDPDRRELARGAAPVALEPQVFDLLHHLIASRARVVGKDELIAEVWRGRIVSDSALSTRINAARSALGDDGRAQRLIRTFPRRGVRFVGSVRVEHGDLGAADKPSIAVLPFANLGSDPDQDYFADGIALDITTALSRNRGFFVVARNSAFTFKGIAVDVRQAAGDLGVRYLLQGSVRRAGTRMRVGGQLVDKVAEKRSGWVRGYAGDPEGAIESLKHAIRLDPLDPRAFLTRTAMAFAHFIAGRDAEAAHGAAEALRLKRDWQPALRVALAANGMLGRRDEAGQALRAYRRVDPRLGVAKICGFYPLRREADRRRLVLGLRRAGVPE